MVTTTPPSDERIHAAIAELVATGVLDDQPTRIARRGTWVGVEHGTHWLRIADATPAMRALATRETAAARAFGSAAVPAVGGVQYAHGLVITIWERIRPSRPPRWGDVGDALARAHGAAGNIRIANNPLVGQAARWMHQGATDGIISRRECYQLERRLYELANNLDHTSSNRQLCHLDAHLSNALVDGHGRAWIVDLETAGNAPWEADLAPCLVEVRRYGLDRTRLDELVDSYTTTSDTRAQPNQAVLDHAAGVYEIWVCAWAVAHATNSDEHADEARARVDTLAHGRDRRWQRR